MPAKTSRVTLGSTLTLSCEVARVSSLDSCEQGQNRAGSEKNARYCTDVSSPQGHLTKVRGFTHRDVYLVRPGFISTSVDNPGCKGLKEVSLQGYLLF